MVLPDWCHCGKAFAHPPHRQQVYRLYTPTINGFERFLREMVSLEKNTPDGGQPVRKRNHIRRREE